MVKKVKGLNGINYRFKSLCILFNSESLDYVAWFELKTETISDYFLKTTKEMDLDFVVFCMKSITKRYSISNQYHITLKDYS